MLNLILWFVSLELAVGPFRLTKCSTLAFHIRFRAAEERIEFDRLVIYVRINKTSVTEVLFVEGSLVWLIGDLAGARWSGLAVCKLETVFTK